MRHSEKCLVAASLPLKVVLDDRVWKSFGYKRLPTRGRIFNRFISHEKALQEDTLFRELWAASAAHLVNCCRHVDGFAHRSAFVAKSMEYCVDGIEPREPIWPGMRFAHRSDALRYLTDACKAYQDAADPMHMMTGRFIQAVGQPLPGVWSVGIFMLFNHPESNLMSMDRALTALLEIGVQIGPTSGVK